MDLEPDGLSSQAHELVNWLHVWHVVVGPRAARGESSGDAVWLRRELEDNGGHAG